MADADYADYIDRLRNATISLRELARRDRAPSAPILEIADRLYAIAEKLGATTTYVPTMQETRQVSSEEAVRSLVR